MSALEESRLKAEDMDISQLDDDLDIDSHAVVDQPASDQPAMTDAATRLALVRV